MKTLFFFFIFFTTAFSALSQSNPPTAVNDYATTNRGYVAVDVLHNDFDTGGEELMLSPTMILPKHGNAFRLNDSVIVYISYPDYSGGQDTLYYRISSPGKVLSDTAMLVLTVDNSLLLDSISANNIKTGVQADGYLFGQKRMRWSGIPDEYLPFYEIPKGGGAHTFRLGNLWIGAMDASDSLHLSGQKYFGNGYDSWAGPVSSVYDSTYDQRFNRVWKITQAEIDYHLAHCWDLGYIPAPNLIDWPGNGDTSLGQSSKIAPFYDWTQDGIYDPFVGDFPMIKGTEAIFFIVNDDRLPHTETQGRNLGVEIRGMLFAFDCPYDSALWNTSFLNLKIVNRSANSYHDAYFGTMFEMQLGDGYDQYVGCDVERGSFYAYNGENIDGIGQAGCYGSHPPAQSVSWLGGPTMDADGLDNMKDNCDEGVNGLNFGNDVIDDERLGLSHFSPFYFTGVFLAMNWPELAIDYYNNMRGLWKDGTPFHYWGAGYPPAGATGPVCAYQYPGSSDTCHWGTLGIDPGGSEPWTEEQAGHSPYTRIAWGSSGPFSLAPEQIQEIDLAFVFGRNFNDTNATAAIQVMQQRIDSIRSYFVKDLTPCGGGFSGMITDVKAPLTLKVYPNPTHNTITIESSAEKNAAFELFDLMGNLLMTGTLIATNPTTINLSGLCSGMYYLRLHYNQENIYKKIIKQ